MVIVVVAAVLPHARRSERSADIPKIGFRMLAMLPYVAMDRNRLQGKPQFRFRLFFSGRVVPFRFFRYKQNMYIIYIYIYIYRKH